MIDKLKYQDGHLLDSDDNFIVVDINARPCDIEKIVTRFNMHEELVAALEDVLKDLSMRAEIDSQGVKVLNISSGILHQARAALNKAKQGERQ